MKRFTRIVEEYKFTGRDPNVYNVIQDIIQNIEYSYEEKKDFYNQYLYDSILEINPDVENQLESDISYGELSKFYKDDKVVNYDDLRKYLYNTYQFDLDKDMDCIYIDCLWLNYLILSMTKKAVVNMNR